MCGIAGIYGISDRVLLKKMCDAIAHRGPDGEGYFTDSGVSLGNRRLSIIDVAGGNQPIHNEDGTVNVVYNGEIYNYLELKKELELHGHRFYTASDTEVIVHAYEEYGLEFPKKLNGMFAIALWDSKRNRLVLCRDHAGIKPLYYFRDGANLYFASEIKALLVCGAPRIVNRVALENYLSYKHTLFSETMFRGIYKLEPGHMFVIGKEGMEIVKWWDMSFGSGGSIVEVREALELAVKGQLMSEVPLGLFLSGGVDSGAIAAIMKSLGYETRSFTVGFDGGESEEARQTAEFLGTIHKEVFLDPRDYTLLPEIIRHMDEPTGDVSSLALYRLSEAARKDVTVVLNGAGGDEVFAGYMSHKIAKANKSVAFIPEFIRKLAPSGSREMDALKFAISSRDPMEAFLKFKEIINEKEKAQVLKDYSGVDTKETIGKRFSSMPHSLNTLLYTDFKTSLVDDILLVTDKMTMAHGLEARVPFLDLHVINSAARLPEKLKLLGLREKHALREAMKGRIPVRAKRPFRMPLDTFFRKNIQEIAESVLSEARVMKTGFFNFSELDKIRRKHASGDRHSGYKLFNLLAFEIWRREFIEDERVKL